MRKGANARRKMQISVLFKNRILNTQSGKSINKHLTDIELIKALVFGVKITILISKSISLMP